jgi:hypothetical protein
VVEDAEGAFTGASQGTPPQATLNQISLHWPRSGKRQWLLRRVSNDTQDIAIIDCEEPRFDEQVGSLGERP